MFACARRIPMEDEVRSGTNQSARDEARRSEPRSFGDQDRQRDDAKPGAWNRSEAQGYVPAAVQQTREAVQQTREYVEDTVQQARDKITEYREGGLEKVKRDVTGYAREEPMTALLLAASVGLVLGWLTAAGRR
jgi:ElaB/YqjD/DUF883 family membrane-anchored ribosome-binding protein